MKISRISLAAFNFPWIAAGAGSEQLTKRHTGSPGPYCMKIKLLDLMSKVIPFARRTYLRAFFQDWDARTAETPIVSPFDEGDVYNGHQFNWSPRVAPKRIADVLLEEHDARVARERSQGWDFETLLKGNL